MECRLCGSDAPRDETRDKYDIEGKHIVIYRCTNDECPYFRSTLEDKLDKLGDF